MNWLKITNDSLPMTILYLVRSPGTGYSIENLFETVRSEIDLSGMETKVVRLPYISRGLRTVWRNLCFVRRLTADVFHITGDVHYAALALPASRTILTIHDCIVLKNNRHRPLRYLIFWLLWYYWPIRRAGVVTAVSEKTRQELLRYVGHVAQRVQVVPNGYDPTFTASSKPFCRDQPTLLQVGTAQPKNLSRLLAAIDSIACTLVIVGPLTDEIVTDLFQRKIRFEHHEYLSREAVCRLYKTCDIVTFVSTYEGFGMPILEANAVGRVVIASAISPMREVAGGAAHLVDPMDVMAIRAGIVRLIRDDAYRQHLIEAGLENARRYTIALTADRYKTLYNHLLSNPLPIRTSS